MDGARFYAEKRKGQGQKHTFFIPSRFFTGRTQTNPANGGFVLKPCGGVGVKIEKARDYFEYLKAVEEGKVSSMIQGILIAPLEDFSQSKVIVSDGEKELVSNVEKNGWYSVNVDKATKYNVKILIPFEIMLSDLNRKDVQVTRTPNSTIIEYSVILEEKNCVYKELEIRSRAKTSSWLMTPNDMFFFEFISKNG